MGHSCLCSDPHLADLGELLLDHRVGNIMECGATGFDSGQAVKIIPPLRGDGIGFSQVLLIEGFNVGGVGP